MQKSAFNNYDPRPIPLGNDLRTTASAVYPEALGIPKKFIPKLKVNEHAFLGGANFPSPLNEVLPCLVNPALKLNRTYGEPPILDGFAYRPATGIARNQPPGLGSDVQRNMYFKAPILPEPMNNNMRNFGP